MKHLTADHLKLGLIGLGPWEAGFHDTRLWPSASNLA